MKRLDKQLKSYADQLCGEIGLTAEEAGKVATLVAADIRFLPTDVKSEIRAASPVAISARLDELVAFQAWSDFANSVNSKPAITRASVVVQNYICFVYLKDACFEVVAKRCLPASVAYRCAKYLTTGLVRDFRNAFSHANWQYNTNFTGLQCWVLADPRKRCSPMREFEVLQKQLNFWQALSRGVAYSTYEQLRG